MRETFIFTPKVKEQVFPIILTSDEFSPEFENKLKKEIGEEWEKEKISISSRELHRRFDKLSDKAGLHCDKYDFHNRVTQNELEMIMEKE